MPVKRKPEDVARVREALLIHPNKADAARYCGMPPSTFFGHVEYIKREDAKAPASPITGQEPLIKSLRDEISILKQSLADAHKPKFTIRQDNIKPSEKIKVVVIGDAHDSPLLDKSRFEWMGAYINKSKPDVVIQIGDFATMDSLNTHVANETYYGKSKPPFMDDMVSFNGALEAFNSRLNFKCEKHCTLGNHERRLYAYEDNAPEAWGMMQYELQKVFDRHSWTFSPYGVITYYGGVGFVHAAINRLGKTYGGKQAENTIANDSIHDLVIGHSHVERIQRAPKIGGNNYVQVLNVGCALPDGHVEEYAQHALTGWSWGIMEITIQYGHIQDRNWISMARLKELHG